MAYDEFEPDGSLTAEQVAAADKIDPEQLAAIDAALLANCHNRWRKVAAVVGFTMMDDSAARVEGMPDLFYAQRVRILVERGLLESQGNLGFMRYSEVRLAQPDTTRSET